MTVTGYRGVVGRRRNTTVGNERLHRRRLGQAKDKAGKTIGIDGLGDPNRRVLGAAEGRKRQNMGDSFLSLNVHCAASANAASHEARPKTRTDAPRARALAVHLETGEQQPSDAVDATAAAGQR